MNNRRKKKNNKNQSEVSVQEADKQRHVGREVVNFLRCCDVAAVAAGNDVVMIH